MCLCMSSRIWELKSEENWVGEVEVVEGESEYATDALLCVCHYAN
jgi:hypothetical protein